MERLRKKRSTIRARTTVILNKIDGEIIKENIDVDILQEYLEQLVIKEKNLRELDKDIENQINDMEELEAEVEGSQDYEERIVSGRKRANMKIGELQNRSRQQSVSSNSQVQTKATIKLPRLTMQKFNGDTSKWLSFWGHFETVIHQNDSLSNVDKLNYLIAYLEGGAANSVAGLPLTEDTYDVAVNILKKRFGKRDLCINSHMQRLLNLCPVKKSSEIGALRKLYDSCEVQVRSLDTLGVVSEAYGSLLCPILMKLIPHDIALEFSRKQEGDEEWKVFDLMEHLRRDVESRERAFSLNKSEPENTHRESQNATREGKKSEWHNQRSGVNKSRISTAAALNTTCTECVYCGAYEHSPEDCTILSLDERKAKLRQFGRCFVCIGKGHLAKRCRSKITCRLCGRRHHVSICHKPEEPETKVSISSEQKGTETVVSALSPSESGRSVLLQTATAIAEGGNKEMPVRCLFDSGSQRSFIRQDVARMLNLPVIGEETLNLHTFGSEKPQKVTRRKLKVTLRNVKNPELCIDLEVLEIPRICSALVSIPGQEIRREMRLRDLQLADESDLKDERSGSEILILIGSDQYWKLVSGRIERLGESIVALDSLLGWLVQGPTSVQLNLALEEVEVLKVVVDEEIISQTLKSFWEIDTTGILSKDVSESEDQIVKDTASTIHYKDGRYEIGLPWKQDRERLGSNYEIAKRRMRSLTRKFLHDPLLWQRYYDTLSEYVESGIIEPSEKDYLTNGTDVYYVPHHPVVREDKATTKLRVVFDASSHEKGKPSLNDCLHPGPNLNPDLMEILLRFRTHRIAFMADVEKAFHQISLAEKDRDFVRLLWIKDRPIPGKEIELLHYRMTRVCFGVTSSPFLLALTLRHHLTTWREVYPDVCQLLADNFYVDDLISGADTKEDVIRIYFQSREILAAASMNLRKWVTNSSELIDVLQDDSKEHQSLTTTHLPRPSTAVFKVLGLTWNSKEDNLTFEVTGLLEYLQHSKNTKRSVLSASAKVFDPIGFLSPYLILVKCLFQELWVRGLEWDQELPNDLRDVWNKWCSDLTRLPRVSIPRWYHPENNGTEVIEKELHMFSDASERAYAAVIYLRYVTDSGKIGVSFVTSKSRVAPLKKITLPRLELMAALIGARLLKYVRNALGELSYRCWTDSMIVICWIQGLSRNWKTFVSNRIAEIQELTNPQFWAHCRGVVNPADCPSRGMDMTTLLESKLWWNGPEWLTEEYKICPAGQWSEGNMVDVDLEKRITTLLSCANDEVPEQIIKIDKFSSLNRLCRITAWVLRFVHNVSARKKDLVKRTSPLGEKELREAELYWIKQTQKTVFPNEIRNLDACIPINRDSPLLQLDPMYSDGLLRLRGRLQHADLSFQQKHPVILPSNHKLSELIVKNSHEMILHGGITDTLIQVRESFWILKGRQLVKKVVKQCLVCRRFRSKRSEQVTAPLPEARVNESPPFEVTGLDFAGPLYVKNQGQAKVYIALFTCAVTRAVHLELVTDMSTEKFLLAFRRFIARRGICRQIFSDNAKTFKRADKDFAELWKNVETESFQNYLGHRKIKWKYIVERAAWWGGFWERLVRSTKTTLKKILGRSHLSYEELSTVLTEVEAVLNSRPLTYSLSEADEPSPITPSHFLIGHRLTSLPTMNVGKRSTSATRDQLARRLRYRETLLGKLWKRWRHEYLMELRSAHLSTQPKNAREIKVDDVVLIEEDKLPRQVWKLGRVVETFPGRDGKVRACAVKFSGGAIVRRPVQMLFPLELKQ